MSDYNTDFQRFTEEQEWVERDRKHAENLNVLADYFGFDPEDALEDIRRGVTVRRLDDNGNVIKEFPSPSVLRPLPTGITDPEFAEWAVQKIARRRKPKHQ